MKFLVACFIAKNWKNYWKNTWKMFGAQALMYSLQ